MARRIEECVADIEMRLVHGGPEEVGAATTGTALCRMTGERVSDDADE